MAKKEIKAEAVDKGAKLTRAETSMVKKCMHTGVPDLIKHEVLKEAAALKLRRHLALKKHLKDKSKASKMALTSIDKEDVTSIFEKVYKDRVIPKTAEVVETDKHLTDKEVELVLEASDLSNKEKGEVRLARAEVKNLVNEEVVRCERGEHEAMLSTDIKHAMQGLERMAETIEASLRISKSDFNNSRLSAVSLSVLTGHLSANAKLAKRLEEDIRFVKQAVHAYREDILKG